MIKHQSSTRIAALGAVTGWFALGLQFHLTSALVMSQGRNFQSVLYVYFAYFTILSNLLAVIAFSVVLLQPAGWVRIFSRPVVLGGIATSMLLVGIVYNLILRQLSHLTGLSRLADELLHVVMPVMVTVYWLLCVPKAELRWRDSLGWALYPALYLVYALVRGALSGDYPYPFINVSELGYAAVLRNSVGVMVTFFVVAALFIGADRLKHDRAD